VALKKTVGEKSAYKLLMYNASKIDVRSYQEKGMCGALINHKKYRSNGIVLNNKYVQGAATGSNGATFCGISA
jgi:hypothetical protein